MKKIVLLLSVAALAFTACKEEEKKAAETVAVSVKQTTSAVFDGLRTYTEYTDDNNGEWLIFTTDTYFEDFWFISIGHNEEPFRLYMESALYKCQLADDLPFLVMTVIPEGIPTRGISMVDKNNVRRYFYIGVSGVDGSLSLNEFSNSKN